MVRFKQNRLQRWSGLIRILFIFALLSGSVLAEAASIQVQLKPAQPSLDEAFQLVFSASGNTDGTPDFSPLDKDFEILSQSQSSQSSWVNGKSSQTISWILNVMARRAGQLTVPEIEFGKDRSIAKQIEVKQQAAAAGSRPDLFLEVTVDSKTPYVQTQVIYTWRIYTRVNLSGANLSEPSLENALVVGLGDNRQYQKKLDGVDYQVIEGQYAIFPQQTGKLIIPPLALTAEVLSSQQQPGTSRFFNFQRSNTRRVKSGSITLQVQDVPKAFDQGQWLAASQLELSQSWSNENLQIKVGEPLTRTLSLKAVGVPKSQLPEISMSLNDANLKLYPEQAQTSERPFENGLSSVRQQKVAIIATTAGTYRLPEINLRWYNTQSGKVEIATLPEVTLTAVAAPDTQSNVAPDSGTGPAELDVASDKASKGRSETDSVWKWVALMLAIGWSLTLLWIAYRRRTQAAAERRSPPAFQPKPDLRKYLLRLKSACLEKDPRKAGQIVREWGMASFGAANLMDIAAHCPAPLGQQITDLNQVLYSGADQNWDAQALLRAFKAQEKQPPDKSSAAEPLRPLYPFPDRRV